MKSAISRHIVFFVYPGFVLLDLSGPLEAFSAAASLASDSYRTSVMSLEGGEIQSSTGLKVMTQLAKIEAIDTFIVVGDFGRVRSVSHGTCDVRGRGIFDSAGRWTGDSVHAAV